MKEKVKSKKVKIWSLKFGFRFLALLLLANCVLFTSANAQNSGSQQNLTGRAGTFAITNAKIVTVSGATIENGTIVISDGKITAVGANVSVPSGAEKIDGKGLSVYPGLIDSATNMGLLEIGNGVNGTVDVAETGDMNSNAKAILGINPHTSHINVTRVNGITTALSLPVSGLISGQSAVINLNGTTQAEMAVIPEFALVINFPQITTFAGFNPFTGPRFIDFDQAIKQRDKNVEKLKKIFEEAERYAKVKDAYNNDKSLPFPPVNLQMDAMIPYVRGEKPIIFTAERARDINGVIKFVEETKVKGIIIGGTEAWKVTDGLKKNNIAVIFDNMWNLPNGQDDTYDSLYEVPGLLQKAGVKFSIATGDDGANARDLPYQAGMAAAFGLPKDEALKAVTLYPAQILGIADKYGSLETGKMANVVVADGDILDARTKIKYLFINGRMLPLTSRHTEFYEAFKNRK
jgi:imidazolonepropionase-like amidohydrolase